MSGIHIRIGLDGLIGMPIQVGIRILIGTIGDIIMARAMSCLWWVCHPVSLSDGLFMMIITSIIILILQTR